MRGANAVSPPSSRLIGTSGAGGALGREALRLLRFLAEPAAIEPAAIETTAIERPASERPALVLVDPQGHRRTVPTALVRAMVSGGALRRASGTLRRTGAGEAMLRRLEASGDAAHASQHRDLVATAKRDDDGHVLAARENANEWPLARLARQREASGGAFLAPDLVEAGERLRADFERGQLRPRVTVNWSPSASGRRADGGGRADLSDAAIGARGRWNEAVGALGSELGPPVVDLCCFGKGLGEIEAERGWPRRSGKLLLRAGLDRLAEHYRAPRARKVPAAHQA